MPSTAPCNGLDATEGARGVQEFHVVGAVYTLWSLTVKAGAI